MSTKNSMDVYGAKGKTNVLMFDPEDLLLVEDPKHPLYDERVHLPVSEALVRNIMHHGVLEPIIFRKNPETGKMEVAAGRQRVKAAREANKRLREQGCEPILIPGLVRRGDDGAMAGIMVSENEVREDDSPLGRAKKMERLVALGKSEDDLGILFGCTKVTVKNTLALLECCADVKKAVEKGEIGVTAAYDLSRLDADDQRKTLAKMLKAGEGQKGRARSQRMRAAAGKKVGPSKAQIAAFRAQVSNATNESFKAAALAVLDWVLGGEAPTFEKEAAGPLQAEMAAEPPAEQAAEQEGPPSKAA